MPENTRNISLSVCPPIKDIFRVLLNVKFVFLLPTRQTEDREAFFYLHPGNGQCGICEDGGDQRLHNILHGTCTPRRQSLPLCGHQAFHPGVRTEPHQTTPQTHQGHPVSWQRAEHRDAERAPLCGIPLHLRHLQRAGRRGSTRWVVIIKLQIPRWSCSRISVP